jgi:hypothetical protein
MLNRQRFVDAERTMGIATNAAEKIQFAKCEAFRVRRSVAALGIEPPFFRSE